VPTAPHDVHRTRFPAEVSATLNRFSQLAHWNTKLISPTSPFLN
jgi:hypothetical protein